MSSVNNTNVSSFYNIYGVKNSGIGGLASGLNTDEIVQSLTLGTRTKIGRQTQQKTMLQWQQTAYRSLTSVLSSFQDKHVGSGGGSNSIVMSSFWRTYKSSATSDKVALVPSATTDVGTIEITEIKQLATQQTMTVNQVHTREIKGDPVDLETGTTNFYNKFLELVVDGKAFKVRLDKLDDTSPNSGESWEQAYTRVLNEIMAEQIGTISGGQPIVQATVTDLYSPAWNFTVKLDAGAGINSTIRVASDCDELGLTANLSNKLNTTSEKICDLLGLTGDSYTFVINNTEITIDNDTTINNFMRAINNSGCGVTIKFDTKTDQFVLTAQAYGSGNNIDIRDVKGGLMNKFVGAGTTVVTSNKLKEADLGYGATTEGNTVKLTDLKTLLNTASSTQTPPGHDIYFTMKVDGQTKTFTIDSTKIPAPDSDGKYEYDDGVTKKQLDAAQWLQATMNQMIADEFGSGTVAFNFKKDTTTTEDYIISFSVTGNIEVELHPYGVTAPDYDLFGGTGGAYLFDATTPPVTNLGPGTDLVDLFGGSTGGKFSIKNKTGAITDILWGDQDPSGTVTNLRELIDALNTAFGVQDGFATLVEGRIVFDSGDNDLYFEETETTPPGQGALFTMFGDLMEFDNITNKYTFDGKIDYLSYVTPLEGKNAQVTANGQTYYSFSNTITIDGIAFEVNAEHSSPPDDPIILNVKVDVDEMVDKIENFINEYNTLITSLNAVVNEKKVDGYAPLTDEQRAEMSESQVSAWEAEAKKGLLYNDSTIRVIIDNLRACITKEIGDTGLTLYDMGISVADYSASASGTGYNYDKAGTLQIDYTKLRNTLENNPKALQSAFTNTLENADKLSNREEYDRQAGVGVAIYDAIEKAILDTTDDKRRGTLITLAGKENSSIADNTTTIGKKIQRIDEYIASLKIKLQNEYDRHWSKFTALETAIQRMNTQSSWLNEFYS